MGQEMKEEICATLDLDREATIRDLGNRFRELGFIDTTIGDFTGKPGQETARSEDLCLIMNESGGGSPVGALVRLFALGVPVDLNDVHVALGRPLVAALESLGLITRHAGIVQAMVQISPFRGTLFAYDPPTKFQSPEYVMGPAQSSVTLANMTVRRPVRRALDLGCGCGVHALLAAAHSDHVVAIDTNPRAVMFSRFNALLNGIDNVECRIGDMFAPLEEEPFGLVTTNPPFVITPETTFIYRDSPLEGDGVTRASGQKAASLLEPGGYASMICDWAHLQGTDWRDRLRAWFAGAGCDTWVLRMAVFRPEAYASTWIGHTETGPVDVRLEMFSRWLDYYRAQSIEQIDSGLMIIRKRSDGDGWFEVREAPGRMLGSCSESIEGFFQVQDWLADIGGQDALLDTRPRLSSRTELVQSFAVTERGWATRHSTLRISPGLAYEGEVETVVAEALPAFNGRRTVGQILARLAEVLETDLEELRPSMLRVVRAMLEQGVLDTI